VKLYCVLFGLVCIHVLCQFSCLSAMQVMPYCCDAHWPVTRMGLLQAQPTMHTCNIDCNLLLSSHDLRWINHMPRHRPMDHTAWYLASATAVCCHRDDQLALNHNFFLGIASMPTILLVISVSLCSTNVAPPAAVINAVPMRGVGWCVYLTNSGSRAFSLTVYRIAGRPGDCHARCVKHTSG
jgi:hypothetical protein